MIWIRTGKRLEHDWFISEDNWLIFDSKGLVYFLHLPVFRNGSMTFWGGSGSCYFRHWPSRCQQKIVKTIFSAYYFLKVYLHHFSKIESQKESQNRRNQGFSYFFCMMIEGSGSGSILWQVDPDPGGPKTCGSGGSGSGTLPPTIIQWQI